MAYNTNITLTSGILTTLAGRYAKALFDLACSEGQVDEIASALHSLEKILRGSELLRRALMNSITPQAEQAAALREICILIKAPTLVSSFVNLLVKAKRLPYLSKIESIYKSLISAKKGEEVIEVISAYPLTPFQARLLKNNLKRAFSKPVQLVFIHSPRVLGGVMVRAGSWVVDATVLTRLNRFATIMKGST